MFYSTLQYARNLLKEKRTLESTLRKAKLPVSGNERIDEIETELQKVHHEINDWLENCTLYDDLKIICRAYYIEGKPDAWVKTEYGVQNHIRDVKHAIGII